MNADELHERFGVTSEQLDQWSSEYENEDWSHMSFGEIIQGRPRITDEPLESITVRIPHSRIVAMAKLQEEKGITKSEFVRRAIDRELLEMA